MVVHVAAWGETRHGPSSVLVKELRHHRQVEPLPGHYAVVCVRCKHPYHSCWRPALYPPSDNFWPLLRVGRGWFCVATNLAIHGQISGNILRGCVTLLLITFTINIIMLAVRPILR